MMMTDITSYSVDCLEDYLVDNSIPAEIVTSFVGKCVAMADSLVSLELESGPQINPAIYCGHV